MDVDSLARVVLRAQPNDVPHFRLTTQRVQGYVWSAAAPVIRVRPYDKECPSSPRRRTVRCEDFCRPKSTRSLNNVAAACVSPVFGVDESEGERKIAASFGIDSVLFPIVQQFGVEEIEIAFCSADPLAEGCSRRTFTN